VVIDSAGHEQSHLRTHLVVGATGPTDPQSKRGAGHRSIIAQEVRTDRRILTYTSYIRTGVPRRRDIALTFDDGPGPFTPRILAVLEHLHAMATFFEIGGQVRADPHITARLARAGMVIGDHTQDHPPLALLSTNQQAAEIDEAARAIKAAGAPRPLLFRPPYGSFDSATLALLRGRDMLMAFWTVDTSDYAQPGVKRIIYTALSGVRPGAIILFHDGGGNRSQTLAALPRIIERLHQRGYRLVTIPKLLEDDPPPATQSSPQTLAGD
jgi:peptidoglycan/xylan/chitin deacetylase (PgdA/CDA1 family)